MDSKIVNIRIIKDLYGHCTTNVIDLSSIDNAAFTIFSEYTDLIDSDYHEAVYVGNSIIICTSPNNDDEVKLLQDLKKDLVMNRFEVIETVI